MPTKPAKSERPQSQADQAIAIYRQQLQILEAGRHDTSRPWRQAVLDAFATSIDAAPNSLPNLFTHAQKKVGIKVSRGFEIERLGTAMATGSVPTATGIPGAPASHLIPPQENAPRVHSREGTPVDARAAKVYADLNALCKDEIKAAFQGLRALIENVDQLGDARALREFTRAIRAGCKRIEDQLGAKALLDKKQAHKVRTEPPNHPNVRKL